MENQKTDRVIREVLIETNSDGVIINISPNCIYVMGYSQEEMIGKFIRDFILDNTNIIENSHSEVFFKSGEGKELYLDITKEPSTEENGTTILFSLVNISSYKERYDRALRLMNAFERTNDIIYSFDIKQRKFTYLSPSIMKNIGYSLEENMLNPMLPFDITHPDDYELMVKKITGEFDYSKPTATRFRHKDGYYLWFEDYITPVFDSDGALVAIEGITRNIQERKELELELEYLGIHDGLTGVYNRTYFEKIKEHFNTEQDSKIGIILCDLDDLKITNDSMGHEEGDALIRRTVTLFESSIDDKAIISRIGGDEFVILLVDKTQNKVEGVVAKLKQIIQIHNSNNPKLPVRLSMGWSYSESSIGCIDRLLKTADLNMYKEKTRKKKGHIM